MSEFLWAEQARARLQWVAAWAKHYTSSVAAAEEEPTTSPRSAAQPAATAKPPEFGATIGRTRTLPESDYGRLRLDLPPLGFCNDPLIGSKYVQGIT